jgi:hypothetical protein
MSMHMIRGVQVHGKSKKKKSKSQSLKRAEADHAKFLKRMGVSVVKTEYRHDLPNYKSDSRNVIPTSDVICGNGSKKDRNIYSGERQLLGVATMHKSNMVPIFADKKEDAKDIASMRR